MPTFFLASPRALLTLSLIFPFLSGNIMPTRAIHERSHSDTPAPPPPLPSVDLSLESSSVTTFRDLPLRKSVTSGKFSPLYKHSPLTHLKLK